jgi:hypothetical protein
MWVEHGLQNPHSEGLASLGSDHECGYVGFVGYFWVHERVRTLERGGKNKENRERPT